MTLRHIAIRMRTVRRGMTRRTAAPEGGARRAKRARVRGCVAAAALAASPVIAADVPSQQEVALSEVLVDRVGADDTVRLRFLAPDLATMDVGDALADLQVLCDDVALPYLDDYDLTADVIVVSLMDRPVPFGQTDPEATQLFEAFRVENGACVLEPY